MQKDQLTEKIIGCALAVHRELGPSGLLINFNQKLLKNGIKRMVL